MKNVTRRFLTNAFALALAANSATVLAQNTPQDKPQEKKVERQIWVDTNSQTFDVRTVAPGQIGDGSAPRVMMFNGAGSPQDNFTYSFVASEVGTTSKVVKGAPYSAEIVNEFVQTLANGNRIVRRNTSNVYRDSQGRTRHEHSLAPIGVPNLPAEFATAKTVMINDPVEGTIYMLDDKAKTARRSRVVLDMPSTHTFRVTAGGNGGPGEAIIAEKIVTTTISDSGQPGEMLKKINVAGGVLQGAAVSKVQPTYPAEAKAARVSGPVQVQVTINEAGEVVNAEAINGHHMLRAAAVEAARQWKFKPTALSGNAVKVQGTVTFNFSLKDDENSTSAPEVVLRDKILTAGHDIFLMKAERNTTPLGKQTIEGIECEGTKIVQIIPAGQIGNEQPIEIVTERWFSPELQITVLSKHSDPRNGETIVKMTNLNRGEPDAQLFKVPSDYTIKDGGNPNVIIRTTKPE